MATARATEMFEDDFYSWKKEAEELLRLDPSEKNKKMISVQANRFANTLKKASEHEVKRLQHSNKKQEQEIEELRQRLERTSATSGSHGDSHGSVDDTEGLLRLFKGVYNKEWIQAFQSLQQKDATKSVKILLDVLKGCSALTKQNLVESQNNIEQRTLSLDGNHTKPTKTLKSPVELKEAARSCQQASVHACLPYIKENLFNEIRTKQPKLFPQKLTEEETLNLKPFTTKCIELCWLMAIKFQHLEMIFDPKKIGQGKETPNKRQPLAWPAVIELDERGQEVCLLKYRLYDASHVVKEEKENPTDSNWSG